MSAPHADSQPDVLVSALALARRGFHVFPVDHPELDRCAGIGRYHDPATCTDRGKHPCVPFTRDASTDPQQVAAWFTGHPRNVGIACGPSGLLVVDEDTDGALARYATSVGQTIPDTFTVATGRGRHFYFTRGVSLGNAEGALKGSGVNIRGAGGFVVGPGSLHATGTVYTVTNDTEAGPVPHWLVEAVSGAARAINGLTAPAAADKPRGLAAVPDVIRGKRADTPGERHEHLVRYASSLRARDVPIREAEELFRVVWRRCEQPPVCETPMPWGEARDVLADVYGRYQANRSRPDPIFGQPEDQADMDGRRRPWQPVDLSAVLDGTYQPPQPTIGGRDDGIGMLYPGRAHTVVSETEGGKTWLALAWTVHEMQAGHHVVYIDFEDDEGGVVGRLLLLGAHPDVIRERFHYLRPDMAVGSGVNRDDLDRVLTDHEPTLGVIDGVTEAMTVHGLNPLDNTDAATFGRLLPRRITEAGAACASLDHVTKATEGRGRYALGAVHKLNALNGAAYLLENRTPFGVGRTGRSTVRIAKDRPGQLRKHGVASAGGSTWFGDLVLTSHAVGFAEIGVEPPHERDGTFRPTVLMQRVADALTQYGPLSGKRIELLVSGGTKPKRDALTYLQLDGYVSEKTPHELIKPYPAGSE